MRRTTNRQVRWKSSFGAVIFRAPRASSSSTTVQADGPEFLLIRHRNGGHWDAPKGGPEAADGGDPRRTAMREIEEETGLANVTLVDGFEYTSEYQLTPGTMKRVVYFLGKSVGTESVAIQESEVMDWKWCTAPEAIHLATHDNSKELLKAATAFILEHNELLDH
ncbi:NUDIX hydrolase [Pelomyxa schiedti]|nr:NUDIX hydrolase [Pelomyxa schiedti]